MDHQRDKGLAAVFLLVAMVTFCMTSMVTCTREVLAQEDVAVELARLCISECLWDCGDECAAIHQAVKNRADLRDVSLHTQLRTHRSVFQPGHQPARPWLAELNVHGNPPRSWEASTTIPWGRRRTSWLETLQLARELLAEPRNPCNGPPLDWGVGSAVARYRRAYPWTLTLDCGPTANTFLGVRTTGARPRG